MQIDVPFPRVSSRVTARAITHPAVALASLVVTSAIVRSAVAWRHSTPRYFPDEFVYAALSRSIAHGHLTVNGQRALFPALVEPILAAPLWRFFPLQTAYHLVQVENAIFASLAALPVYFLARRLGLSTRFALLCSVYTLVTPTLVMIPLTLTDFVGYSLVLTALLCAQRALEHPGWSEELLFVTAAGLATLTRTEYFVLVPSYIVAAFVLDRRRAVRRHAVAFAAVAPAAAALVIAATGYFSPSTHDLPLDVTAVTQIGLQLFLMSLVAGVVIVPGALVALWRPHDRAAAAFASITVPFIAFLVSEIGIFSVTTAAKFRERYLFAIVPLLALSFGIYLKRALPYKWAVFLISVALAVAAARVPVSAYSTGAARFDSQTLIGLEWFQKHTGAASTAFLVAALLTFGGLWATLAALRGRGSPVLPFATALAVVMTIIATHEELRETRSVRRLLPTDMQWIDHTVAGPVTAVATPLSSGTTLLLHLYWNPTVKRLVLLDDADEPVQYAGPRFDPGRRGVFPGIRGYFLFDREGTQATFANAQLVTARGSEELWHSRQDVRVRTLAEGMWSDGWLIAGGRIRAWPSEADRAKHVELSFFASVPRRWPGAAILRLNGKRWRLAPGKPVRIACSAAGLVDITYRTPSTTFDQNGRPVSVRLTHLRESDGGISDSHTGRRTSCRTA